ncbi:UDP-glucose 4-epimerase GalE [Polaribacter reichenbachii]|uniref:UDP-glucose 4-epimerase n=1 Tax=Polaribacter reichenbachii TaxID=996801 RepID=A0A1B8TRW9_9FLAO|nr:UDP-glucose 4-epimerase GalE [Polaribacter reichenbachii]APZ44966.1 UDP-glucose 4-epimerase GalE [Polaribacter reichenbachii]AUC18829.1 UDP-glucose 4-epimerase GalE [Polaribacter reichenbachii]OBY62340.1 UDP-glucose 4-epimerase [Polaribacter reichenbachii]
MKRILVTGGLGFIGSHTVVELQNEGFEVVIIDNLSNTTISVLDSITEITGIKPDFHQIDLRVKDDVKFFFDNNKVDGIIHFAAYKAVGESMGKPLEYYENNLGTLVYLLQEMRDRKLDNFIFSSSCTVYGQADELPITENAPVKAAESVYGNTKQIGEEIIRDASNAHNINTIALRYFNPVGAHPTVKIGELPLGVPQNLIPFITQTAAGIREQLSVFGDDYPTEDGTAVRDYIHVVDLAKAHIAALTRLINKKNKKAFEYFNIGTGTGSSVLEVINTFEKVNNLKLNYKIVDRREGDVVAAYADTTIANKELNWKTEKDLGEALESAWKWQQKQS